MYTIPNGQPAKCEIHAVGGIWGSERVATVSCNCQYCVPFHCVRTLQIMASDQRVLRMKERFHEELKIKRESASTKNRVFIDDKRYEKLLEEINTAKRAKKRTTRDYWLLQHYDSITVGQKHKLIFPVNLSNSNIIYYVADSELFDVLHDTHQNICNN